MSERARHGAAVAALIVLGAVLRFGGIAETGPYLHDDAVFHAEGRWMSEWWDLAKDSVRRKLDESRTGVDWKMHDEALRLFDEPQGRAPLFGRPGMSALVFAVMRVFGPVPWAAPAVSALFGSLIPLFVYGIGRTLFTPRAALLAMLFASLGGLSLFYDRSGLGETASVAIGTAAILAQLRAFRARPDGREVLWMALAGALWSASVVVHNRWMTQFAIPVAIEVAAWLRWRERGAAVKAARALAFALAATVPFLLAELPYYLTILGGRYLEIETSFRTYLQTLVRSVLLGAGHVGMPAGEATWNGWTIPYVLLLTSGPVFLLAFAAGAARGARERTPGDALLLFWILSALWVPIATIMRPRYASIGLPAAALVAGRGLEWIWLWSRSEVAKGALRRAAGPALLVAAAAVGAWRADWLARESRQGYVDAMAWLDRADARSIMLQPPIGVALRGDRHLDEEPSYEPEDLRARCRAEGWCYWVDEVYVEIVRDFNRLVKSMIPAGHSAHAALRRMDRLFAMVDDLRERPPAYAAPNPAARSTMLLVETGVSLRRSLRFRDEVAPKVDQVRVYDLRAYFDAIDRGEIVPRWASMPREPTPEG